MSVEDGGANDVEAIVVGVLFGAIVGDAIVGGAIVVVNGVCLGKELGPNGFCGAGFLTSLAFGTSGFGLARAANGLGASAASSMCGASLSSSAGAVEACTAGAEELPVVEGNDSTPPNLFCVVTGVATLLGELSGDTLISSSTGEPKAGNGDAMGFPNIFEPPNDGVDSAAGLGANMFPPPEPN